MKEYIARKLDEDKSTEEKLTYQYKYFSCKGNSQKARRFLHQHLENFFPDSDPLLVEFKPVNQNSWRYYLQRENIPEDTQQITIKEFEETHPVTKAHFRFIMSAFIQTVPESLGEDGFYISKYIFAKSLDEAIKKAKCTYGIELNAREGFLRKSTLQIKKVGKDNKWQKLYII